MKRKHKSEDDTSSENLKNAKLNEVIQNGNENVEHLSAFDMKQFRKDLSTSNNGAFALTQFLQICINPDNKTDYMLEYLESGGNAHEILRQINNKKNLSLAGPALHLFQLVLVKVQSIIPHLIPITEEASRYFLNNFQSTIEMMISEHSSSRHKKIILKLLASMVTLNPGLGIEILNQFPLDPKNMGYLAAKGAAGDENSVRIALIQFLTSFTIEGSLSLLKALLEKYGLLSLIIPGMVHDEADTVLMVLDLMKSIVENVVISKTLKLHTFNHQVIQDLFKLFNWVGPKHVQKVLQRQSRSAIADSLYGLLFNICTSSKFGVYFADQTMGTGEMQKNQNIYKALQSIKKPWDHEKQSELVLSIIKSCPEFTKCILHVVELAYHPKNSNEWYQTNLYLRKVLSTFKPQAILPLMKGFTFMQIFNFIKSSALPIGILKQISSSMESDDMSIINEFTVSLHAVLTSLKEYLVELRANYPADIVKFITSRLDFFLPKHFPSLEHIVKLHNQVVHNDYSLSKSFLEMPHRSRILINIINLLMVYFEIRPHLLESTIDNIDTIKLLDLLKDMKDGDVLELKIKVASLLVCVDKYALSPEKSLFRDVIVMVLQAYKSTIGKIYEESRVLLKNMLIKTYLFDENHIEVDLLLYCVKNVQNINQETVFNCLAEVVQDSFLNVNKYKQLISAAQKNTSTDFEATLVNFDELLDTIDMASHVSQKTKVRHYSNSGMSVFIVGLLKYLKKNKTYRSDLNEFVSCFLVHLLHLQESAIVMAKLIEDFKINANLKSYIEGWITEPQSLYSLELCPNSMISRISHIFIGDKTTNNIEIFTENVNKNFEEIITWINTITFYVANEASLATLDAEKCEKYKHLLDFILQDLIKGEEFQSRVHVYVAEVLLTHPTFLRLFIPLSRKRNIALTEFLLYSVNYLNKHGLKSTLEGLLKPYQQKIFLILNSAIGKSVKKGKSITSPHLLDVLNTISLNDEDNLKILHNLIKLDVTCFIQDETEQSTWLDVMSLILKNFSMKNECLLPEENIAQVMEIYEKLLNDNFVKIVNFEQSLYSILNVFPEYIKHISISFFHSFMKTKYPSPFTIKLGALLLEKDSKFVDIFEGNLTTETMSRRELILSIGNMYIHHECAKPEILQIIYNEYYSTLMKIIDKPHKAGQSYIDNKEFVVELVHSCMSVTDCVNIINRGCKYEVAEAFHVELLQAIAFKILLQVNDNKADIVNQYFIILLNFAVITLKASSVLDTIKVIISSLNTLICYCMSEKSLTIGGGCDFEKVTSDTAWQNFYKQILMFSLKLQEQTEIIEEDMTRVDCLSLLAKLTQFLYPKNHKDVVSVFEITTSHSEFLNIMLSYHSEGVKSRLLELLLVALINNKSVMKSTHIPVYLSSYRASLSASDRLILAILHAYEVNGQPMCEYQPYLWGDAAASYYSIRRNRSSTLWSRPTPNQLLNLLDKEKVSLTVKHFPTYQKMNYIYEIPDISHESYKLNITDMSFRNIINQFSKDNIILASSKQSKIGVSFLKEVHEKKKVHSYGRFIRNLREMSYINRSHTSFEDGKKIYDPAFLLPLLSHIMAPESVISCFKIMRSGVISICIMAMSSECPSMRMAAYYMLSKFYALLEADTKHKNDKFILTQFIDTLKTSLSPLIRPTSDDSLRNPRLPAISAMYLARALNVINAPFDPLYKPVNNYLIARSCVDLTVVPDLLSLLHDCAVEHSLRRYWILQVIRDGMRTTIDGNICFKSMTFKMLLDLYSSILSDKKMRRLILEVIQVGLSIPKVAEILINGHGILSWLSGVFKKINRYDMDILYLCVSIVETIWYSSVCNSLHDTMSKVYINVINQQSALERVNILSNVNISRDVEIAIFALMLDLLPNTSIMSSETFYGYVICLRKFSKSTLKLLTKPALLSMVNGCHLKDANNLNKTISKIVDLRDSVALKALMDRVSKMHFEEGSVKECSLKLIELCIFWL